MFKINGQEMSDMEALKDRDELCRTDIEYALEGKERRKWCPPCTRLSLIL